MKKIIAGIIALLSVCTGAAVYLERKYLRTDRQKFSSGVTEENINWINSTPHKDEYMITRDGYCMHGLVFDNNSDNWIVAVHGYDSESRGMVRYAKKFLEAGYSVFMPDLRGMGNSDDNSTTMGHLEKLDIIDWIRKLNAEYEPKNIVLFGVSMGAATVMLASGENLPENVRATIEDCGYSSVREEFEYNMLHLIHLPPYPVLWICDVITRLNKGWSFLNDADCIKAVKRSRIPICFIHGANDTFVPFAMQEKLYSACRHKDKEILVIDGAEHTEACVKEPELYWNTVFSFIEKHII
ncbi:MAG: alpha/beta hydrolase [Ruminiclostridium sp.]|nr:alpha/beta hydrolase [Ruminiclostridium sp.]